MRPARTCGALVALVGTILLVGFGVVQAQTPAPGVTVTVGTVTRTTAALDITFDVPAGWKWLVEYSAPAVRGTRTAERVVPSSGHRTTTTLRGLVPRAKYAARIFVRPPDQATYPVLQTVTFTTAGSDAPVVLDFPAIELEYRKPRPAKDRDVIRALVLRELDAVDAGTQLDVFCRPVCGNGFRYVERRGNRNSRRELARPPMPIRAGQRIYFVVSRPGSITKSQSYRLKRGRRSLVLDVPRRVIRCSDPDNGNRRVRCPKRR
ncbi:hypothetical protein GKE82_11150 [Conexibacter sp. W3-3-2]|uniref:hypothetical protein n=1 Tax=Conexibacter sp. W3-3-2 TaxID=2675227 RepID=UPI0012B6D649|nr:hypothetical protein [Conexibacter sp. W3-3-2]MTD44832.1 hypothetical protein [Conexibacter sp. W3-3-2]